MLKICVPFLLPFPDQIPEQALEEGWGVEATLFRREHLLDDSYWERCTATVRDIAKRADGPVIFHFPVEDCDYVADRDVANRLEEAVTLVEDVALAGLVVHANRVRPSARWAKGADLEGERERVVAVLLPHSERLAACGAWIGLENMPIMGNEIDESDPTFVYARDFDLLRGTSLRVTWDICHASYSAHVTRLVREEKLPRGEVGLYPNLHDDEPLAWVELGDTLAHLHFGAFNGVASGESACEEGVVPWSGDLPGEYYEQQIQAASDHFDGLTVTLEIKDDDYRQRHNMLNTAQWLAKATTRDLREAAR